VLAVGEQVGSGAQHAQGALINTELFATRAIGRDVSITNFTASSLNSGEKLFFGRGKNATFPDSQS
jgi:hypothetical protein